MYICTFEVFVLIMIFLLIYGLVGMVYFSSVLGIWFDFFCLVFVSLVFFDLSVKLKCCLIGRVFWWFYRFYSLFSCADYALVYCFIC